QGAALEQQNQANERAPGDCDNRAEQHLTRGKYPVLDRHALSGLLEFIRAAPEISILIDQIGPNLQQQRADQRQRKGNRLEHALIERDHSSKTEWRISRSERAGTRGAV